MVWAPVYWRQYGAQNFLYFCDLGNFLIAAGLWLESRIILSWQAVGLLVFQTLYALDLIGAVLFGHHIVGGTEYMFDPKVLLFVRLLGLYHLVVPPLLLWSVRRLGYDDRAWKLQTLIAWVLVPINFFWRPEYNVNWARGLGHEQHGVVHRQHAIALRGSGGLYNNDDRRPGPAAICAELDGDQQRRFHYLYGQFDGVDGLQRVDECSYEGRPVRVGNSAGGLPGQQYRGDH